MNDVLWLSDISKEDANYVGQKAVYLNELINAKLPVPSGFVICTDAYKEVFSDIENEVNLALSAVTLNNLESLNRAAVKIRDLFLNANLPKSLEQDINTAYNKMNAMPEEYKDVSKIALDFIKAGRDRPFLIARSSSLDPNTPSQQASFFDINGIQDLFSKLKLCWSSLFTPRAIYYRKRRNLPNPAIAVIIQERPNLLKSGNIFSVNPLDNNKDQLLIQARWGFSAKNSEGSTIYVYNKHTKNIENKNILEQNTLYVFDPQIMKVARRDLSSELKGIETLSSKDLEMMCHVAQKINLIFKFPQDIEWGISKGKFYVLQSRPITSVFRKPIISGAEEPRSPMLLGIPASPGKIKGNVCVSSNEGGILLAKSITSNIFNSIFGASALILEGGDLKSLPAIIARELNIPCIVRTEDAVNKLKEGQEILLDASSGKVYSNQPIRENVIPETNLDPYGTQGTDTSSLLHSARVINSSPKIENMTEDATVGSEEPASIVMQKLSDLEATLTELVLQEAQKRRDSPHEMSSPQSKMISDLEWEVRNLREKVEKAINNSNPDQL